jgi:hypothetical protein
MYFHLIVIFTTMSGNEYLGVNTWEYITGAELLHLLVAVQNRFVTLFVCCLQVGGLDGQLLRLSLPRQSETFMLKLQILLQHLSRKLP